MSQNYPDLSLAIEDNIAIVTIEREKALNAINGSVMRGLNQLFLKDLPKIIDLAGVIIKGSGNKAFVAGADIKEFQEHEVKEAQAMSKFGHETFFAIERFPKPVIASINGFVLGGGLELAMACHLRVATDKSKFGQPEVNLGLIPGYGGTQRLIQFIGKGRAMHMLLSGDMIDANQALEYGLINLIAEEDAHESSMQMLKRIIRKGPLALAQIINCVNEYHSFSKSGFELEVDEFGNLFGTEDFKEGVDAFISRRKADFKGR